MEALRVVHGGIDKTLRVRQSDGCFSDQHSTDHSAWSSEGAWKPGKSVVLILSMRLFRVAFAISGLRNVGRMLECRGMLVGITRDTAGAWLGSTSGEAAI